MGIDRSFSAWVSENALRRYVVAVVLLLASLLACDLLSPFVDGHVAYVLLFPTVAFSALYCGIGPSILVIVLALVGAKYRFIPPIHSFRIPNPGELVGILAFLCSCSIVVVIGGSRRRHNEKLRKAQGELEHRVRERTAELDTASRNLRELSARLLQLQDDERRRIARELHDSVGQMLAALAMNLATVQADIEHLAKTATTLTDSEALVQEMSTEVRTISHLLHPPLLDEAGLSAALRWYVEGFAQRSKIKVDLDFPDDFGRLSRELETAIFRVVQECLTNVHRHSGSTVAKIRIRHRDSQVLIQVEDKGKGIPAEKQDEMVSAGTGGTLGVGIRGMRERLRQLGGTLKIDSNGTGTVIVAQLPISRTSSKTEVPQAPDTSTAAA